MPDAQRSDYDSLKRFVDSLPDEIKDQAKQKTDYQKYRKRRIRTMCMHMIEWTIQSQHNALMSNCGKERYKRKLSRTDHCNNG